MRNSVLVLFLVVIGPIAGQTLKVEPAANPSGPDSSQVNWSVTQDGNPLLIWVQSDELRYSIRRGGQWSAPQTVAAKRHFFHHPAEMPEVMTLPGGTFMAHWIEQPNPSSEAEFLYVSASRDGVKWTTPVMAHHDRSEAQHGLASMISSGDREVSVFWLQALKGEDGPTSLMRTVLGTDGNEIKEESLDADVCSCCPTAVTKTARGLLVAFRNHTKDNVRDIAVTRLESGRWTVKKTVYPDKWELDACPVNAAAVAAKGDRVALSPGTQRPAISLVWSSHFQRMRAPGSARR